MTPEAASFETAQAAADSVYSRLGMAAPAPMAAETALAYRVRLARGVQQHSPDFINVNLAAVARADSVTFGALEKQIFAQADKFSHTPRAVADGQLREIVTTSSGGHRISTFVGDPFAWMRNFMLTPKRVRVSRRDEISR
jgi:hypothetical protein